MDPAHRTLMQVSVDDAAVADRTFDMLMGRSCFRPTAFHPNARGAKSATRHLAPATGVSGRSKGTPCGVPPVLVLP